jgi:Fe-S cluster assembly protein SufD
MQQVETDIVTKTPAALAPAIAAAHARFAAARSGDPAWVRTMRAQSLAAFAAVGLPTRRDEDWKYTGGKLRPLGKLTTADATPELAPELLAAARVRLRSLVAPEDAVLVLVDGMLRPDLSRLSALSGGLTVAPLATAFAAHGEALQATIDRTLRTQDDVTAHGALTQLAGAFLGDGLYLRVAANTQVAALLHVVHLATVSGSDDAVPAVFPRLVVDIGSGAAATLLETFAHVGGAAPGAPYIVHAAADVHLAPNAQLTHVQSQLDGVSATHIGRTSIAVEKDARVHSFVFSRGAATARRDLDIVLLGAGADARLDGLYLAGGTQHFDHHTTVDHSVPDATSDQVYKGVLNGESRAVFNGKVLVRRDAQRTRAFQLNRNLLLSGDAEIDTKPELRIDADDVKCSHGAAIAQLDADHIFYLQSRGLKREEAERLLTIGFADDVLDRLAHPGVRSRLAAETLRFFEP